MRQHTLISEQPWLVAVFGTMVALMLLLDLGVFNRKAHVVTSREALVWSAVWIGLAMGFSVLVHHYAGADKFFEFQSAYWIEKALSVDNLFVFILVLNFFKVPAQSKHKVLFFGIIGALVLRAVFIFAGAYLIRLTYLNGLLARLGWKSLTYDVNLVMTVFGFFLLYAGVRSWKSDKAGQNENYHDNKGARLMKRFFRVGNAYHGSSFFTIENGKRIGTPLLLAVGVIEFTDLLFAIDSIPAIFAVSDDPLVLYTSNIFAILGLRALFFLLDNFIYLFGRLRYGLAMILCFIGVKMIASPFYHVESVVSLAVIGGVLALSVALSLLFPVKAR